MDEQFNIRDQINNYLTELTNLRRKLHGNPDLSGEEGRTVQIISDFMMPYNPDEVISEIGGHGLAFVYHSEKTGPAIMIRCELDALPIKEINDFRHKSQSPKVSHKCGHDGHMAIIAGVGVLLSQKKAT